MRDFRTAVVERPDSGEGSRARFVEYGLLLGLLALAVAAGVLIVITQLRGF